MSNLPYPNPENFVGEFEEVDLSKLKDKTFGVAIGLGDREGSKYACSTLMAPLDFYEMVEAVAGVWQTEQLHAKAFILKKDLQKGLELLDPCTIDFIEARYLDILAEMVFEESEKEFTCQAKLLEVKDEPTKSDTGT